MNFKYAMRIFQLSQAFLKMQYLQPTENKGIVVVCCDVTAALRWISV